MECGWPKYSTTPRTLRRAKVIIAAVLVAALPACFIPDDFDLEISISSPSEVGWKFNGKWQFFFVGYDPRSHAIPPRDVIGLTAELAKLPGSTSVAHLERNIWKQSISWQVRLRDAQNRPVAVVFPTGTQPTAGPDYWLVRVTPEAADSALLETIAPPSAQELALFASMGYKSVGSLTLKTTGTVMHLSGPQLVKSWFSSSYSTKWGVLSGAPIKVRVKW